jgi:hypothetical protein
MAQARVTNRLPQLIERQQRRGEKAVLGALILGAAEASTLTPIDTSNLINSQFRKVDRTGTRIVGTVGYTAAYALAVHDPDNKQTFRRASAEKEFLRKGFERNRANILSFIRRTMKV